MIGRWPNTADKQSCKGKRKGGYFGESHRKNEGIPNVRSYLKSKIILFSGGTAFCLSHCANAASRKSRSVIFVIYWPDSAAGKEQLVPGLKRCLSESHWIEMKRRARAINAGPQRSAASFDWGSSEGAWMGHTCRLQGRWGKVVASPWQLISCEPLQLTNQLGYIFHTPFLFFLLKVFFYFYLNWNTHTVFRLLQPHRWISIWIWQTEKFLKNTHVQQTNVLIAFFEHRQGQIPFKVCHSKDFNANITESKYEKKKTSLKRKSGAPFRLITNHKGNKQTKRETKRFCLVETRFKRVYHHHTCTCWICFKCN